MSQLKFIDLFAGIGGFRIALEQAGGECVFSSEIDKYAKETYQHNFNDLPEGDITEIDEKDIPDHDILCAGFPCQPFSIAGKRMGFEDTRGTLFFHVARILKEKKPKAFILENVSGIVNHDKGNTLEVILQTLSELEYTTNYKVMNAKKYGIPQNRDRWYCIGFREELGISFSDEENDEVGNDRIYHFPKERDLQYDLNDVIEKESNDEYEITPTSKKNIDKFLPDFISGPRYNEEYPLIANEIRPSRCHLSSTGISPCLTAKMGTGGNNIPVVVKSGRKLTERECLRIMGFPDWYQIKANYHQSYKQIGNSVVVPLIYLLAKEMVDVLEATNEKELSLI